MDSAVKLEGGKLKLKSYYDPDPNKKYEYYGPLIINSTTVDNNTMCYPCGMRHFDYVLGRIETAFTFPKNIRIQAKFVSINIWKIFLLHSGSLDRQEIIRK